MGLPQTTVSITGNVPALLEFCPQSGGRDSGPILPTTLPTISQRSRASKAKPQAGSARVRGPSEACAAADDLCGVGTECGRPASYT